MVFVEGLAGQVFSDLGLTVVTSLIASLIVAILFIPMLASRKSIKLKSKAGMVTHVLGGLSGRVSLATLLLRILLPIIALLGIMVGLTLLYRYWRQSSIEVTNPDQELVYSAIALSVFKNWLTISLVPFLVALAKTRFRSKDFKGTQIAEIWGSLGSLKDQLAGG